MSERSPGVAAETDRLPIRAWNFVLGGIAVGVGVSAADSAFNLPQMAEVVGYSVAGGAFAVGCFTAAFDMLKAGGFGPGDRS